MTLRAALAFALLNLPAFAAGAHPDIDAFNRQFRDATLHMDNAAVMELWDDAGTTLLPGMAAIEGKANITKWLNDLVARMPGYRVTAQDNDFHDIQVSGDWASEWGTTHQTVQPPNGQPPIETRGKILLVLHKDAAGAWRIREEMWNADPRP